MAELSLPEVVSIVASLSEALAVIIAAVALVAGQREARASRDLEIFLNLSESFRARWEGGWSETLTAIGADHDNPHVFEVPAAHRTELVNMLNWVDWLGTIIKTGGLSNDAVIFGSIGVAIRRIVNAGRPLVEQQSREFGPDYWASLFVVARRLGIDWVDDLLREVSR